MNKVIKSKSDFFYSKSTGLYVSRKPLKIDSRVKKAAEKIGLSVQWDDEGRISFVNFDESKLLVKSLGSQMLSPIEYWKVLEDAKKENNQEMLQELMSSKYCEWLDRVYLSDKTWIDHPELISQYTYHGEKKKAVQPFGRPAWFNPENNIDFNLGIPKKIDQFRGKFSTSWKYWDPDFSLTAHMPRAPIRGYVTSVGKPSFDQGIPVDAKQPMQMIRECRISPLEPPIKFEITHEALEILNQYNSSNRELEKISNFLSSYGNLFRDSKQTEIYKIREKFFDLLGILKIEYISKQNHQELKLLESLSRYLSNTNSSKFNYAQFSEFITTSKVRLSKALADKKDIVFVMGHKNPDTDTVISSIFESWRNSVLDCKTEYVPIVQNYKIPDEIRHLLGDELSDSIVLGQEQLYQKAKQSGLARWISVDQNREPEVQRYFISIIDHHVPSEISLLQDLPKTMEIMGSCTALVVQKMVGSGIYPDKELARILHGATLMDTENRVVHKMTPKDHIIMDYLKQISGMEKEEEFYSDLMSFLLNTDDPNILFGRDYKEDWGFGFAVAKIKNGFGKEGNELKKDLIKKSITLAEQNNLHKNLPLTVLRITDYEHDNITVNRERVYLVFNKESSREFVLAIFNLLEKIVKFEFDNVNIKTTPEFIEFWGTGMQLSRKKTAPILEPVVNAFNEYFYSPSNNLWIKRDFLKRSKNLIKSESKLGLKVSFDEENRVNYLTYPEAKSLVSSLGFSILSLKEYWLALNDAKKIKDIQMISSLQGSNFVEFLDTIIKNNQTIIEHPSINSLGTIIHGTEISVKVPKGKPGLIDPNEIDLTTGIPNKVMPPSEYGNPHLWRYWEPDSDLVIPVRSYIFLLKQPCWDGKFHINDSLPNLGIRPCCKIPKFPKTKSSFDEHHLNLEIINDGDIISYSWEKGEISSHE